MGPSVQTVLTSALVAAAVTLVIEIFAKPLIEVRKDRLLRRSKERDELARAICILSARFQALDIKLLAFKRFGGHLDDVSKALESIEGNPTATLSWLHPSIRRSLFFDIGYTRALIESLFLLHSELRESEHPDDVELANREKDTYRAFVKEMGLFGMTATAYINTPRWKFLKRWKLRRQADTEIKQLDQEWDLLIGK